jgi:hypothetical protein
MLVIPASSMALISRSPPVSPPPGQPAGNSAERRQVSAGPRRDHSPTLPGFLERLAELAGAQQVNRTVNELATWLVE